MFLPCILSALCALNLDTSRRMYRRCPLVGIELTDQRFVLCVEWSLEMLVRSRKKSAAIRVGDEINEPEDGLPAFVVENCGDAVLV